MLKAVVLVGPMGAGKSTIGKKLAKKLDCNFQDVDQQIENAVRKPIPQIFAEEGEAAFRHYEEEEMRMSLFYTCCVLAGGGGVVLSPLTRQRIKANSDACIFLDIPPEVQYQRVTADTQNVRPLAQGDQALAKLTKIYQQRLPLYKEVATLTVDARQDIDAIVEQCFQHVLERRM